MNDETKKKFKEYARVGGNSTKRTYGKVYYSNIGKKSQDVMEKKIGKEGVRKRMSRLGKKSIIARKSELTDEEWKRKFSEMGKKSQAIRRVKREAAERKKNKLQVGKIVSRFLLSGKLY